MGCNECKGCGQEPDALSNSTVFGIGGHQPMYAPFVEVMALLPKRERQSLTIYSVWIQTSLCLKNRLVKQAMQMVMMVPG